MIKYQPKRSLRATAVIFCATTTLLTVTGCSYSGHAAVDKTVKSTANVANVANVATSKNPAIQPAIQEVVGDYASAGYDKRQQGYDWVGVMVREDGANNADQIDIKVRARGDIKQPSCRYDGKATFMGQDDAHGVIFQTIANDSVTFLQFKDGKLTVDSQDKQALHYFCSGGGTLAGDYQKLAGHLELS